MVFCTHRPRKANLQSKGNTATGIRCGTGFELWFTNIDTLTLEKVTKANFLTLSTHFEPDLIATTNSKLRNSTLCWNPIWQKKWATPAEQKYEPWRQWKRAYPLCQSDWYYIETETNVDYEEMFTQQIKKLECLTDLVLVWGRLTLFTRKRQHT